jgi:hypothetical protein
MLILGHHLENRFPQFPADAPATVTNLASRTPMPISAKSCSMPAHHRFWSDNQKRLAPLSPHSLDNDPEQLVDSIQLWSSLVLLQNGKLLPKN